MPWQASKFRPEVRVCGPGRGMATAPHGGFLAGKARRSAEIRGAMGLFASKFRIYRWDTPEAGA
jgi:hypothetical protein